MSKSVFFPKKKQSRSAPFFTLNKTIEIEVKMRFKIKPHFKSFKLPKHKKSTVVGLAMAAKLYS